MPKRKRAPNEAKNSKKKNKTLMPRIDPPLSSIHFFTNQIIDFMRKKYPTQLLQIYQETCSYDTKRWTQQGLKSFFPLIVSYCNFMDKIKLLTINKCWSAHMQQSIIWKNWDETEDELSLSNIPQSWFEKNPLYWQHIVSWTVQSYSLSLMKCFTQENQPCKIHTLRLTYNLDHIDQDLMIHDRFNAIVFTLLTKIAPQLVCLRLCDNVMKYDDFKGLLFFSDPLHQIQTLVFPKLKTLQFESMSQRFITSLVKYAPFNANQRKTFLTSPNLEHLCLKTNDESTHTRLQIPFHKCPNLAYQLSQSYPSLIRVCFPNYKLANHNCNKNTYSPQHQVLIDKITHLYCISQSMKIIKSDGYRPQCLIMHYSFSSDWTEDLPIQQLGLVMPSILSVTVSIQQFHKNLQKLSLLKQVHLIANSKKSQANMQSVKNEYLSYLKTHTLPYTLFFHIIDNTTNCLGCRAFSVLSIK